MLQSFKIYDQSLTQLPDHEKLMINTINAHSYNLAQTDKIYRKALLNSNILIPDGISIVWAIKWLTGKKHTKIAGADLFYYEMERLQNIKGKCFFLGSTPETLKKIAQRIKQEYPDIRVETYSPPFKQEFTSDDNLAMLKAVNSFAPDVLMIGMTAPKQEKWAHQNYNNLLVGHICAIGAVFDFYAGTIKRAPKWMISMGLEWFYRLIKEPKRMWRRYLLGNVIFLKYLIIEKMRTVQNNNIQLDEWKASANLLNQK